MLFQFSPNEKLYAGSHAILKIAFQNIEEGYTIFQLSALRTLNCYKHFSLVVFRVLVTNYVGLGKALSPGA